MPLAEGGSAEAAFYLGATCYDGERTHGLREVPSGEAKQQAIKWFEAATAGGHYRATQMLARMATSDYAGYVGMVDKGWLERYRSLEKTIINSKLPALKEDVERFSAGLKVGDKSHCGLVIEVKRSVVKVYYPIKGAATLIGFCGLEWEEGCLDFHKTERAVRTASSNQVRKKMYTGSSDVWRRYEEDLRPMMQALEL